MSGPVISLVQVDFQISSEPGGQNGSFFITAPGAVSASLDPGDGMDLVAGTGGQSDGFNFQVVPFNPGSYTLAFSATADGGAASNLAIALQVADPATPGSELTGSSHADILVGGLGANTLSGNGGADFLFGQSGADNLNGGTGDDGLDGGAGNDFMVGRTGDDTFFVSGGEDSLIGGGGHNTLDFSRAPGRANIDLRGDTFKMSGDEQTFTSIRNIIGGSKNDDITGDERKNVLNGEKGADTLTGGKGADALYGGDDDAKDVFAFGSGDSGVKAKNQDQVFQFDRGEDKIDLSALHVKWSDIDLHSSGQNLKVEIDTNGNNHRDLIIKVMDIGTLHESDFIL